MIENTVKISGRLHFIEGVQEQISRMGKYVAFSVRQDTPWEDGSIRHDFLLMRAFDSILRNGCETKKKERQFASRERYALLPEVARCMFKWRRSKK